jgi:hypothetical protein
VLSQLQKEVRGRSVFSAATAWLRLSDVSTGRGAGRCVVTRAPPVRGIVRRKLICCRSGSFHMELIEDAVFVGQQLHRFGTRLSDPPDRICSPFETRCNISGAYGKLVHILNSSHPSYI